jgi:hypothetical protein
MDSNNSVVSAQCNSYKKELISNSIYFPMYRFPPELIYCDFIEVAKDLSRQLKDPNGAHHVDLVIALTHMRVPNDVKLANSTKGVIDLVLGG